MNAETAGQFKTLLEERKAELNRDVEHLREELRDLSIEQDDEGGGAGNHFADDGSSLGEQERIATMGGNFQEQLNLIDQALERIEEGEYGACQRCGREIPLERLEAIPFTPYCIHCQKQIEEQSELFGAAAGQR